ncbi:MAG: glycosyltransferase [Bacteroidales bacterium]|nr:glycosyltransferase [Bacteroidales bacterium]
MKNVCFFNSIKFWGGGEKLHLENAIEFKKNDYNVIILSDPKSPLWEKAKAENIQTFPFSISNNSFVNPIKMSRLISFYKDNKIDTVIFSSSQDLKAGSISAKKAGVKNIVYLRGLSVPIKASIVNKYIFKSCLTHIISNSEDTKRNILVNLGKYINADKVKTIYHGIDTEQLNEENNGRIIEIEEKGHGIILGNAGRLTVQKGQDNLIEVAKKLKDKNIDFTLFLAGTGELKEELQKRIDDYGLQNDVILLGFVDDVESFMRSIDIFLLSSIWEGFGFVIVEAMAKSKPVVAFDITSNPEIIAANETGFLADYPNVDMFADLVTQLIKDKDLRLSMGTNGRNRVKEKFILTDRAKEVADYIVSTEK